METIASNVGLLSVLHTAMTWDERDKLAEVLREKWRLKINLDYAITVNHQEAHLLCHRVFLDTITEVTKERGITFTTVHLYG